MAEEEKEQHGTVARHDNLDSEDCLRLTVDASDSDSSSERTALVVKGHALTISAAILSCGAVAALFHFIDLCFKYPDSMNAVLTLMFTVLIPGLIRLWQKRRAKKDSDG